MKWFTRGEQSWEGLPGHVQSCANQLNLEALFLTLFGFNIISERRETCGRASQKSMNL